MQLLRFLLSNFQIFCETNFSSSLINLSHISNWHGFKCLFEKLCSEKREWNTILNVQTRACWAIANSIGRVFRQLTTRCLADSKAMAWSWIKLAQQFSNLLLYAKVEGGEGLWRLPGSLVRIGAPISSRGTSLVYCRWTLLSPNVLGGWLRQFFILKERF